MIVFTFGDWVPAIVIFLSTVNLGDLDFVPSAIKNYNKINTLSFELIGQSGFFVLIFE